MAFGLNTLYISKNTSEAEKNKIKIESYKEIDLNLLDKALKVSNPIYLASSILLSIIANVHQGNVERYTELHNDFIKLKNKMGSQATWLEKLEKKVKSVLPDGLTC